MLKAEKIKLKFKMDAIRKGLKKNPKKVKALEDIFKRKTKELDKDLRDNGLEDVADLVNELMDRYVDLEKLKKEYL